MDKEYILCAAVHFPVGDMVHGPRNVKCGMVFCGSRHSVCLELFSKTKYSTKTNTQGFITNLNRFVKREEAGKIAFKAGQTKEQKEILFSEDLY